MRSLGRTARGLTLVACLLLLPGVLLPGAAAASDHADPIILTTVDAGITGLFAFPDGDDLALILTVRRSTSTPAPFDLEGYEYTIHIDTHSKINFRSPENNARYGGTVDNPEGISADATVRFRLDNQGAFLRGYPDLEGFQPAETRPTNAYSGLRDDPFIFPRFAQSNVIAMAVTIPFSSFQGNPDSFLIWGTTTTEGWFGRTKQIDHVGRSARTQAARFDFLNTVPPDRHVQTIEGKLHGIQASLKKVFTHAAMHMAGGPGDLFAYVFGIRERYDVFPDVMIFSRNRPAKYPNGRQLADDIVGLTCKVGDCVLQEVASFEAPEGEFPRVRVHTPPFSDQFPYLTEPLRGEEQAPHTDACFRNFLIILVILLVLWILWCRRRMDKFETPWVRPRTW